MHRGVRACVNYWIDNVLGLSRLLARELHALIPNRDPASLLYLQPTFDAKKYVQNKVLPIVEIGFLVICVLVIYKCCGEKREDSGAEKWNYMKHTASWLAPNLKGYSL
jgi:hypothetical protein